MNRVRALASAACVPILLGLALRCTTFSGLTAEPEAGAGATDGYLGRDQAARACARVFECPMLAQAISSSLSIPVRDFNFAQCMDWLSGPLPANHFGIAEQTGILLCMVSAPDCAGARACLPWEEIEKTDPRCADAGGGQFCLDDQTFVDCDWGSVVHCDSAYYGAGSRCLVGKDGTADCAISKDCTDVHGTCIGGVYDTCSSKSGLHTGEICAVAGHVCGVDQKTQTTACLTNTSMELCDDFVSDCHGSSLVACDGYAFSEYDCAALGGTCAKNNTEAYCTRPGDECTTFDATVNACNGTSISLCIGGKKVDYDCARIGKSCVQGNANLSGHCG